MSASSTYEVTVYLTTEHSAPVIITSQKAVDVDVATERPQTVVVTTQITNEVHV